MIKFISIKNNKNTNRYFNNKIILLKEIKKEFKQYNLLKKCILCNNKCLKEKNYNCNKKRKILKFRNKKKFKNKKIKLNK